MNERDAMNPDTHPVRAALAAAAKRGSDDRDLLAGYSGEPDSDPELVDDMARAFVACWDDEDGRPSDPDSLEVTQ